MKLGTVPENLAERIALISGIIPSSIFESWFGFMLSRTIMAATKLDIFEALAAGSLAARDVAEKCGTHPAATQKLLNALVAVDCVRFKHDRYSLRRSVRPWLLKDGKHSFRGQILLHYLEWRWWEHCEEYVRTGVPLRIHDNLTDEEWGIYQRGMRAGLEIPARWVARNLSVPEGAREMLDIGGSHGYFSVAMCRRHANLRSTVLDLPTAIKHAGPLLMTEGMGDRVIHRAGNVLVDDLGNEAYDVVLLASVIHHFDNETNRQLVIRIARALRPRGVVGIWEPVRQNAQGRIRQLGGVLDLYFGFFSEAGTWSADDIARWFQSAGLKSQAPRSPRMMPDLALHIARKRT